MHSVEYVLISLLVLALTKKETKRATTAVLTKVEQESYVAGWSHPIWAVLASPIYCCPYLPYHFKKQIEERKKRQKELLTKFEQESYVAGWTHPISAVLASLIYRLSFLQFSQSVSNLFSPLEPWQNPSLQQVIDTIDLCTVQIIRPLTGIVQFVYVKHCEAILISHPVVVSNVWSRYFDPWLLIFFFCHLVGSQSSWLPSLWSSPSSWSR